jgi:hypothetical protein
VLTDALHQAVMVNLIETTLDVAFDGPLIRSLVAFAIELIYSSWSHRHA